MALLKLVVTYLSTMFFVWLHLYPLITSVLNHFHLHVIRMSADISKMFREIGLASCDRDLHRFFHEDSSGNLEEWSMCRVTLITSSPFLAS